MALLVLIDIGVLWWRLLRRYHLYQLDHIIGELHYIAQGHLEHRIPFRVNGNQQHVITSVNALVDTITQAMQEDQYQSEEDIVKYSHIAYDKAKQMKNLVEDLFEYTKVQQHGAPVNLMTVDLGQLLEQVGASFELEADKKGMAINVTCEPMPLSITADPEKLGRLFSNLVANALKYGHGASYIHLTAKQLGEKVVITVANDGEKIPAEAVKHLFERFYRVESSRNKATGGTGLGLAIVQSIVELHHGSVTARSDDQETAFVVTLPVKQVQKEVR